LEIGLPITNSRILMHFPLSNSTRVSRLLVSLFFLGVISAVEAGTGFWHYFSDPQNYNISCGVDVAQWDIVTVTVAGDAPAGDYVFKRAGTEYTPDVVVRVAADGSWGYVGGLGEGFGHSQFTNQAEVDSTWTIPSKPENSSASINGEVMFYGGVVHDAPGNCGTLIHGSVTIAIDGPATQPAPDRNQTKRCDENTGCGKPEPMATYSIHLMLASLHIEDSPISYAPPRGPRIDFQVVYNQREANQPAIPNFGNLGANWTHNWLSYVSDNPSDPSVGANVYQRGGGTESYTGWNSAAQSYAPEPQSMAVLVKTSGTTYERRSPDGSKEVFSVVSGSTYPRRVFMSQVIDAAGNAVTLTYDTSLRLTKITDPLGQITTLTYALTGDPLKLTKVTDPFSRSATFTYTSGQLAKITDPVGIQSQFAYHSGSDFINALTTPYGTTTFAKGENGNSLRWLEAIDPLGGKERVEYKYFSNVIPASEANAPSDANNSSLDHYNTFYWNKKAMADAPGDYTKAQIYHWLLTADGKVSGIKHSRKQPLESRIWYTYAGQTGTEVGTSALPLQIARTLDDSSTQRTEFEYNALGNLTKETDPVGRVFSYIYAANGIDLLEKRQTRGTNNELLASYTYNSQRLPLTVTDAAGQTTTYTYNNYGQVLTVKNAKTELTSFTYDRDQNKDKVKDGYLLSTTGPVTGATTTLTYDAANRIATVTDSDGYKLTYTYDNIDRPLTIKYPDNTTTQFAYTDDVAGAMTLDLTKIKDRRGRWTYRHYNANRQLDKLTDPLNRDTIFDWCTCGSLASIKDAKNNLTTFVRDVQGRVTSKVFADSSATVYTYENSTSRLKSMTDARNQVTNYLYNADDTLSQTSYTNTSGQSLAPPTPTVSFTYDPNYNRAATMTDGTGTTTYTHYPITGSATLGAGQLQSVTGPLPNSTITYSYDQLGRELSEAINGMAASQTYDPLGRVATVTNPLGLFTNTYMAESPRLQSTIYPNGQSTVYTYFANRGDKRLQTLQNKGSGRANISKFDYTYDAEGEILSWNRQFGSANAIRWANNTSSMADLADQLTTVIETDAVTKAVRTNYNYAYDPAGNRMSDKSGSYSINNLNQITNSGYTYDANGSLTSDIGRTYEWDAANRLTAINYPATGSRTEFTYDGLGRRVQIVEKTPGISITVQPPDNLYTAYVSQSTNLPAGNYNLVVEGLGGACGFIDAITLNGGLAPNGGFESPVVDNYAYNPPGGGWTFLGRSGLSGNAGAFTSGNPNAPDGVQVAFIEVNGYLYQPLTFVAGTYWVGFQAAQRGNYNGAPQQLRVSVQSATPIVSAKNFVWIGDSIAEERDANNNITKRFYPQGVQLIQPSTVNLFYTRDHLGSIRELTDSTQATRGRYDYDPYGVRTKLSGDVDADFGYTGQYFHPPSGLNVALYRGYNPATARWLNRDPIAEAGGLNLYGYVGNNPVNRLDPLGLDAIVLLDQKAVARQGHIATLIGDNNTGWTYYSRNGYGRGPLNDGNGDTIIRAFRTYNDFATSEFANRYDFLYHIKTSKDEDLAMTTYGDANAREKYHSILPPSNNCADLTEETLEAGGHKICGYNQYPVAIRGIYIGSPEVPKFLFQNLIKSGMGRLWNVSP
jgi:RHS repeat-associated protein